MGIFALTIEIHVVDFNKRANLTRIHEKQKQNKHVWVTEVLKGTKYAVRKVMGDIYRKLRVKLGVG